MTSPLRTSAANVDPGGDLISPIARPITFELFASPWTIISSASAAPRRSECTLTVSPLRTWVSSELVVACCGEMEALEKGEVNGKQLLDRFGVFFINHKYNHMVVALNDGVMVSNNDLTIAH